VSIYDEQALCALIHEFQCEPETLKLPLYVIIEVFRSATGAGGMQAVRHLRTEVAIPGSWERFKEERRAAREKREAESRRAREPEPIVTPPPAGDVVDASFPEVDEQ
jgi:hypothetical protein